MILTIHFDIYPYLGMRSINNIYLIVILLTLIKFYKEKINF